MELIASIDPLYSLSGFGVGVLVGLTGVGGGSLMTPLLVLLFGVHPATAVGTDLLFASLTKTAGTLVHGINRTVDWRIVALLAAGSVPAAALTLSAIAGADTRSGATAALISAALGWALLATAAILMFRGPILRFAEARRSARPVPPAVTRGLTIGFGAVLGVLVSLSSVGAGAIGVTVLLMLYPLLPTARIVGSDIVHAVPLTLVAGIGYWMLGEVDWSLLAALSAGSIPGVILGSLASPRIPEAALRPLLAGVLALVGAKLVLA